MSTYRALLLDFVQNAKVDVPYPMRVKGKEREAKRVLGNIRTELSRARDEARDLKLPLDPFKIIVEKYEQDDGTTIMWLKKTYQNPKDPERKQEITGILQGIALTSATSVKGNGT